jgi:hypothetical protein
VAAAPPAPVPPVPPWQTPLRQVWPVPHALPQAPQLVVLVLVLTQVPLQSV